MNRIRKVNEIYQVLITPNIKMSPDSSLMIGNWDDSQLRGYSVLEYNLLNDAQCSALKYPDIDWGRIISNHVYIFKRLEQAIQNIINDGNYNVEFISHLMDNETLKNVIFDRVLADGNRFNLQYGASDIISFTIVNPWTEILHKLSKDIELHREHFARNDVRIKSKKIIDEKIIVLLGLTEFGTTYQIMLVPSIIHQWLVWANKNKSKYQLTQSLYAKYLTLQNVIDDSPVLR